MDPESESDDGMDLETSPDAAKATGGAQAQNEGEDQLAPGEDDPPEGRDFGAALSKVMKLPKTA